MQRKPKLEWKRVREQTRIYHFPDGGSFRIERVVRIAIPGTTHRLETKDGRKFIVRCGWMAIELVMKEWSF